ncbi:lipid A biosynthesis acyltransferase [Hylemonella gracilis str. Niagara R]|uniref:Lipid A biosynthesis acyltransferase n=1 Tax=Hylemonella gracilis str. Niagara R TaxID=1458275 RepID=A0A016XL47_9BURK|nr:lysophospholipid acyltransferase family protein [Hylemonella gracilis]EYC52307.1 lipid A biosynthesis acyltransferase [Hylemonella gracilis str. Niagara R]
MILLFRFLSRWPLVLLHVLGWLLGWLVFGVSPAYRRRFVANIRQAGLSWRQASAAVGQTGCMVLETPRLWFGRPARVQWAAGSDVVVQQALDAGKGILILTPHLGCFESIPQEYARRFGAQQPITVLYRPSRQPYLREIVATARQREHLLTAPTTMGGVKQMLKALRAGQCVGLLPDQVPPEGLGVWAPFFGREAYTMTLSARLAQQTGAAVLLFRGERLSWGRGYRLHVQAWRQSLPDDLVAAATAINQAMETVILNSPGQYLWGYSRYKQPRKESV